MKILSVADLHYSLPQFDWLLKVAPRYDLVVVAGDLLDGQSMVTTSAQMVVVLKYLERLRELTTLLVCSGNHDLNHVYSTGERYARWVQYARAANVHVDGDTVQIGDTSFTICSWWDGRIAQAAIGKQLASAAATRGNRWYWIYHAPPAEAPVSWSGSRYFGDRELSAWIETYRPGLVFCGHVHEAPFSSGGSWVTRIGDTLVFNAGRQIGDVPTHISLDIEQMEAAWFSIEGAEGIGWAEGASHLPHPLTEMPAWMPRASAAVGA